MDKDRDDLPKDNIWMQVQGNEYDGYETITWCNDRINEDDIPYVKLSAVKKMMEDYFGHVLNDGSGKPLKISTDEITNDLITLLEKMKV